MINFEGLFLLFVLQKVIQKSVINCLMETGCVSAAVAPTIWTLLGINFKTYQTIIN